MTVAIRCENLVQVYGSTGQEVTALRGVDLSLQDGERLALLGPSGSGKSTLLWVLAGLLRPTAGLVECNGRRMNDLTARAAAELRASQIGVVLQTPARNLLSYDTSLGNLLFAQRASPERRPARRRRAEQLLDAVGLSHVGHTRAGRLSGGEQQRLSVAVALVNRPRLLLADEPTSQLDRASAAAVLELLRVANSEAGTTLVVVTHDPDVGDALGRTITIRDGRVGAAGVAGVDYLLVGRDGTVALPPDLLDALPPGSLARAVRLDDGVALHRVDPQP